MGSADVQSNRGAALVVKCAALKQRLLINVKEHISPAVILEHDRRDQQGKTGRHPHSDSKLDTGTKVASIWYSTSTNANTEIS